MSAYKRRWNNEHKQHNRENRIRYLNELKIDVLTHYGGNILACVQCGFTNVKALTIDHIGNDGSIHRRLVRANNSQAFYLWLRRNNYPKGFQTLCYNCQMIKEIDRRSALADERAGI